MASVRAIPGAELPPTPAALAEYAAKIDRVALGPPIAWATGPDVASTFLPFERTSAATTRRSQRPPKAHARLQRRTGSAGASLRRLGPAASIRDAAGHPMVPLGDTGQAAIKAGLDSWTVVHRRYADEGAAIEVLCTKAGQGTLAVGIDPLPLKGAKPSRRSGLRRSS